MSKKIKGFIEAEFKSRFDGIDEFLVVSTRGIPGTLNNEFRGDLLEKQIHVMVVKNSLAVRAFEQLGKASVRELFKGPCSVVYGGSDVVDLAKVMADWAKKLEFVEIKGGYLEGEVLDASQANALSKMPSREELQATVVMLAKSPGSRLAGALTAPAANIAGCIKSLVEKLEEAA